MRFSRIQKSIISVILLVALIATGISIIENSNEPKANTSSQESIGFISEPYFWLDRFQGYFECLNLRFGFYKGYGKEVKFEEERSYRNIFTTVDKDKQIISFSNYYILLHLELLLFAVLLIIIFYRYKKDGKKRRIYF